MNEPTRDTMRKPGSRGWPIHARRRMVNTSPVILHAAADACAFTQAARRARISMQRLALGYNLGRTGWPVDLEYHGT